MSPATAAEPPGPAILALHAPVTEELLVEVARNDPGYRFEFTAAGRLVASPPTGTSASFGESELVGSSRPGTGRTNGIVLPATAGSTLASGAINVADADGGDELPDFVLDARAVFAASAPAF